MRTIQISWVLPNAVLSRPQHETDRPMSLSAKLKLLAFTFGVLYFVIRGLV